MKMGNMQGLLDRVRGGDALAAQQLQRAMQPVLSRAVRQILQAQEFGTPLGQRVWGVMAEDGISRGSDRSEDLGCEDLGRTAFAVAQKICRQTVAGLGSPECGQRPALETVWS
jgi:hypothetical protein